MSKKGDTVDDVMDLEKEIQDALDEAEGLGGADDPPALDADDEALEVVAEATDDSESDDSADDGGEAQTPGGDEPEAEAAGAKDEKPDEPEGGGTPKPDEPEAEAKPDEQEEERPSDKFGKLDGSVNEKTRERFDALRKGYDDLDEKYQQIHSEQSQWLDAISSVNAKPEQMGTALAYIGAVNEGTPESLERAYSVMEAELAELSRRLGKPGPGHDPLESHPDLKQRVEEGDISREDANELAQFRATKQLSQSANQQAQQAQSEQQEHQQAMNDIGQLGARLRAADPMYQDKMPALEKIVSSVTSSGIPKRQWAATIESLYSSIPSPVAPPANRPPADTPAPISGTGAGTGGGGSLNKEAGSVLEAVEIALS